LKLKLSLGVDRDSAFEARKYFVGVDRDSALEIYKIRTWV
jgi:hypothetical protein